MLGTTFRSRPYRSFALFVTMASFLALVPAKTVAQEVRQDSERTDEALAVLEDEPALLEVLALLKEETVTSASRYEQPISQAPANIYVITDEDIRQSGAIDIPTLLRLVPGMEVMQTTGAEFNVSVRGDNQLGANKVLVLVDGRSIYEDAQGNVFWKAIPVTLPEIKRIEVLKGPAGSIYGFNAFDGVVNIITKSPEELKGVTGQVAGGEFGTVMASAIAGGTYGKLGYRVSYGYDQTNQWDDRDAVAFRSNKFNIHTEYALSDQARFMVSGGLVDASEFNFGLSEINDVALQPNQGYVYLRYERPNFFVRGYWNHWDNPIDILTTPPLAPFLRVTDRNGDSHGENTENTYNLVAQHTLNLWNAHRVTYGANYRHNTFSSNFIDEFSREDRLGLYGQDEWTVLPPLTAAFGFRMDLDTFIHPTYSPRVALIYTPIEGHTIRAEFSRGFRPPTLFETHVASGAIIIPFMVFKPTVGSKDLGPEEITSYELAYQGWYWRHRVRLRAAIFFNHLTDPIQLVPTGPALTDPITAMNVSGIADIYGGEAGVDFLLTPWLSGFANYSFQDFNQSFTGAARRTGPRSKVNAGLRAEWDNGLSGGALVHYVGSTTWFVSPTFNQFGVPAPDPRVGSYTLLNLRGAYRFWEEFTAAGYRREAEVAISAFNALNDEHKEHPRGETIKSRVLGWLTVRF